LDGIERIEWIERKTEQTTEMFALLLAEMKSGQEEMRA
jgi:hypothetical protein